MSAGEATIDTARSQLTVVVAASDSPHGIINFLPPLARTLSEDAGTVAVSVFRSGGLVGELTVNISVIDITAMMPSDFIIANNSEYTQSHTYGDYHDDYVLAFGSLSFDYW